MFVEDYFVYVNDCKMIFFDYERNFFLDKDLELYKNRERKWVVVCVYFFLILRLYLY